MREQPGRARHQQGPPSSWPLALHTAVGAGCKQGGQSLAGRAVGISCSAMHATSSRGWSGRMEWEGSTVGCGCVSKQGPGGPQAALGGAAATASGQCTTSLDVAGSVWIKGWPVGQWSRQLRGAVKSNEVCEVGPKAGSGGAPSNG